MVGPMAKKTVWRRGHTRTGPGGEHVDVVAHEVTVDVADGAEPGVDLAAVKAQADRDPFAFDDPDDEREPVTPRWSTSKERTSYLIDAENALYERRAQEKEAGVPVKDQTTFVVVEHDQRFYVHPLSDVQRPKGAPVDWQPVAGEPVLKIGPRGDRYYLRPKEPPPAGVIIEPDDPPKGIASMRVNGQRIGINKHGVLFRLDDNGGWGLATGLPLEEEMAVKRVVRNAFNAKQKVYNVPEMRRLVATYDHGN